MYCWSTFPSFHSFGPCFSIDVYSNRKMLQMLLQKQGFAQITVCVDGQEAVEAVERHGIEYFDLILMDSVMPKMCGPDAACQLRALGYQHLLFGVTGNALDADIAAFEKAGADWVFLKPMKVETIGKLIRYLESFGNQSGHPLCSTSYVPEQGLSISSRLRSFFRS